MGDFFETFPRGNVAEVKVVLASVVAALAFYQVFLMAVGYGKVRLSRLEPVLASRSHRAIGDAIVVVSVIVAAMCLGYFEFDEADLHAAAHIEADDARADRDEYGDRRGARRRRRSASRVHQ